ncbi:reverse transcriptase, partial [candidate division KSB1 bacterium]|nr:reverse transcriptase [candidate division KSB1 bacterium]
MIRLPKSTYNWALKHLLKEGDTDLFPIPFEINAIKYNWDTILPLLAKLDLTNYIWDGGRRFVVPKEKTTFRSATQLHPLDSLILAALIKQHGNKIEKARIPKEDNCVFSYRFDPQPDGRFYGQTSNWHEFWKTSLDKANNKNIFWVVIADITDYYNQIYH